jgi:hypothetical protein
MASPIRPSTGLRRLAAPRPAEPWYVLLCHMEVFQEVCLKAGGICVASRTSVH